MWCLHALVLSLVDRNSPEQSYTCSLPAINMIITREYNLRKQLYKKHWRVESSIVHVDNETGLTSQSPQCVCFSFCAGNPLPCRLLSVGTTLQSNTHSQPQYIKTTQQMVIQDVVQGCHTKLSYKTVIQGCCTRLETPHIASSLPSCCLHMNKSWWDEVYTDVLAYMYKLVHGNCVYPRVDWQISTCGYNVCFNTSLSSPSG